MIRSILLFSGIRPRTPATAYWLTLVASCAIMLIGCSEQAEIARYRQPKPEPPPKTRMIAAMIPQGKQSWFFKVMGLADQVESYQDAFEKFVRSVHFGSDGKPEWELPESWRELPGDGQIIYRKIELSRDNNPTVMTISPLPSLDVLSNVNRWRGQLALEPISKADIPQHVKEVKLDDGLTAYFVNFTGKSAPSAPGTPPFASSAPPTAETDTETASDLKYEAPPEWKQGAGSAMRAASFAVSDGTAAALITITALGPASGDLLANVNRWRGQIQLPEINEKELTEQTQVVDVGGMKGTYVVLKGPEVPQPKSILGVIVPRSDRIWFVKMIGDSKLVEREKERFEKFTQSLRLP